MSVLIRGIDMPSDCDSCFIPASFCPLWINTDVGSRHPDCPLIPVPPHGDLIGRDALMKQIEHDTPLSAVFEKTMRRYLQNAPTIVQASFENHPKTQDSRKITNADR